MSHYHTIRRGWGMRHMIRHIYFALVIVALATITTGTAAAAFVAPPSQLPAVESISPGNGAQVRADADRHHERGLLTGDQRRDRLTIQVVVVIV